MIARGITMQQKTDPIIRRETGYIALWSLIFSAAMQAVFLIINQWNYTVLLGNLLGFCAAVGNFYLMARDVVKAMDKEPKDAKQAMKLSGSVRLLALFLIAVLGAWLPVFNTWAVLIPLLFPRLAIALRPLVNKGSQEEVPHEE
jgi:uncharacterized membrane protein